MRRACGLRLAREMADGGTPIGLGARCICCATPARGEREGERKGGGREEETAREGGEKRWRGREGERARERAREGERDLLCSPRVAASSRLFACSPRGIISFSMRM